MSSERVGAVNGWEQREGESSEGALSGVFSSEIFSCLEIPCTPTSTTCKVDSSVNSGIEPNRGCFIGQGRLFSFE